MRGSPLVSLALVGALLLLAWIPLQRLLGDGGNPIASPVEVAENDSDSEGVPTRLRLSCTSIPDRLELKTVDTTLFQIEKPGELDFDRHVEIPIPPEGIVVFVDATWPQGTERAAVRIELAPEGMEEISTTSWSEERQLSDVVEFVWKEIR